MFDTRESCWAILTDGRDVMHFTQNKDGQLTSGQPMALFGPNKDTLIALFFDSYTPAEEFDPKKQSPKAALKAGLPREQYTIHEIKWLTGYTQEEAAGVEAALATTSFVRITALKHPARNEWTVPYQDRVMTALPDGDMKAGMAAAVAAKTTSDNLLTRAQMVTAGWFA